MKLSFEGEFDYTGDQGPEIGGRDLVAELERAWPWKSTGPRPEVRVFLGVETNPKTQVGAGGLWTSPGFRGGDETPPESPEIKVGGFELLLELIQHDGKQVALVVEGR